MGCRFPCNVRLPAPAGLLSRFLVCAHAVRKCAPALRTCMKMSVHTLQADVQIRMQTAPDVQMYRFAPNFQSERREQNAEASGTQPPQVNIRAKVWTGLWEEER